MALFEYRCPRCNRPTLLDPDGACCNTLNDGTPCGSLFPLKYGIANSKVQKKVIKHTNPPPAHSSDDYSWTDSQTNYALYQLDTAKNGSVNLDPDNGYLFLFHAPKGPTEIAKVFYSDTSSVVAASGCVMPLNSQLQNMHSHFNNYLPEFVPIATGQNIVIQHPSVSLSTEFRVIQAGNILFSYDTATHLWKVY